MNTANSSGKGSSAALRGERWYLDDGSGDDSDRGWADHADEREVAAEAGLSAEVRQRLADYRRERPPHHEG